MQSRCSTEAKWWLSIRRLLRLLCRQRTTGLYSRKLSSQATLRGTSTCLSSLSEASRSQDSSNDAEDAKSFVAPAPCETDQARKWRCLLKAAKLSTLLEWEMMSQLTHRIHSGFILTPASRTMTRISTLKARTIKKAQLRKSNQTAI